MILRKYAVVVSFVLMLAFAVSPAGAERQPEPRESADHVITGVIEEIHTERSSFGRGCLGSGTRTDYTARIKVDKVEKGTGIQVAKTIEVRWFHVTRQPLDPPPRRVRSRLRGRPAGRRGPRLPDGRARWAGRDLQPGRHGSVRARGSMTAGNRTLAPRV